MYIHQSSEWPHFTWDQVLIGKKLIAVNRAVGYLSGKLSAIGVGAQQEAMIETVTSDIVSSYEIEGVLLDTEQVRSSVARRMGAPIPNETEPSHYIDGIVEMMLDATNNFSSPLTSKRLFGWHHCLFPTGRSGMSEIHVGQYRVDPMDVVSGTWEREKVHYHAPEPDKVPGEMESFLKWFNAEAVSKDYVKSAVAHFWFVCIHPFDDGNGRIARAISDMALSQADNSAYRYFSISHQINKEKRKYGEMLERCQKRGCDITMWIEWYLDCLMRAVENAIELFSSIMDKAAFWQNNAHVSFTDRQRQILNIYLDGYIGKLTTKNWKRHAKVSPDTAARDIKDLVEKGVLVPQSGQVRNVSYGIRISEDKVLYPGLGEDI